MKRLAILTVLFLAASVPVRAGSAWRHGRARQAQAAPDQAQTTPISATTPDQSQAAPPGAGHPTVAGRSRPGSGRSRSSGRPARRLVLGQADRRVSSGKASSTPTSASSIPPEVLHRQGFHRGPLDGDPV